MTQNTHPDQQNHSEAHYRIAAVSKLIGMPIPTIRMWERRYGVVTPGRSAGNGRLYSRADIDRLSLLKMAVDEGHAIGTIASLSDAQIHERLKEAPTRAHVSTGGPCRVAVCGQGLANRLELAWQERTDIMLDAGFADLAQLATSSVDSFDVLIIEIASLQPASLKTLRQMRSVSRNTLMIVVYGFANKQSLARLDQAGIIALAQPSDPAHLARICLLGTSAPNLQASGAEHFLLRQAAPRRFDDNFLATVARQPSSVRCECPHHLADLLSKLNAFEQYSLDCESADPADASIHALLYATAAHSRELLEHALQRVLEHEGRSAQMQAIKAP